MGAPVYEQKGLCKQRKVPQGTFPKGRLRSANGAAERTVDFTKFISTLFRDVWCRIMCL